SDHRWRRREDLAALPRLAAAPEAGERGDDAGQLRHRPAGGGTRRGGAGGAAELRRRPRPGAGPLPRADRRRRIWPVADDPRTAAPYAQGARSDGFSRGRVDEAVATGAGTGTRALGRLRG